MGLKRAIKIGLLGLCAIALFAVAPAIYAFMSYYGSLQQEVITRFSGKRWTIPSRIYSDSVTIYPGQRLDDIGFFERIARLNYHRAGTAAGVNARGVYYYDQKRGRLLIFLHSFQYPYKAFDGELVGLKLAQDGTVTSIDDGVSHQPVYSIELEP